MEPSQQNTEACNLRSCNNCACSGNFQPILDLKKLGVTIYQYKDAAPGDAASDPQVDQMDNNMFVIMNTRNMKVTSHDILPELDNRKSKCPRCQHALRSLQKVLQNKIVFDQKNIGVCDHCQTKLAYGTCEICEETVQKFLAYYSGLGATKNKQVDEISRHRVSSAPSSVKPTTITFKLPLKDDIKLKLMIEPASARAEYSKERDYFHSLNGRLKLRRQRERDPIRGLIYDKKKMQTPQTSIKFHSDESIITPFVSTFSPAVLDRDDFKYVFPDDSKKEYVTHKSILPTSSELIKATKDKTLYEKDKEDIPQMADTFKGPHERKRSVISVTSTAIPGHAIKDKKLPPQESVKVLDKVAIPAVVLPEKTSIKTQKPTTMAEQKSKAKETEKIKTLQPPKERTVAKSEKENLLPKVPNIPTPKAEKETKLKKESLPKLPSKPTPKDVKETKPEKENKLTPKEGKPPPKAEKEKPLTKPPDKPPPKAEKEKPLLKPPDKPPPKAEKGKSLSKLPDKPPPKPEKEKTIPKMRDKSPPKEEKEAKPKKEKSLPKVPSKPPPKNEKETKPEKENKLTLKDGKETKLEKEKTIPKMPDTSMPKEEKAAIQEKQKSSAKLFKKHLINEEKIVTTKKEMTPPKAPDKAPTKEGKKKQLDKLENLSTKDGTHDQMPKAVTKSMKESEQMQLKPPSPSVLEKALKDRKPDENKRKQELDAVGIKAAARAKAEQELLLQQQNTVRSKQDEILERARLAAAQKEKEFVKEKTYLLFNIAVNQPKQYEDVEMKKDKKRKNRPSFEKKDVNIILLRKVKKLGKTYEKLLQRRLKLPPKLESNHDLIIQSLTNFHRANRYNPTKIKGIDIVKSTQKPQSPAASGKTPLFFEKQVDENASIKVYDLEEDDSVLENTILPPGVMRFSLSDPSFIAKGWTVLPIEKIVRKMNIYRVKPAHPEFNWFALNKNKKILCYETGEKLADFTENGRGRWYYRNGNIALDYYDSEELNAQQRIVVYSNAVETDRCRRVHPVSVLAMFDYLGSAVVFGLDGKIRVKYNQTEGVVLDSALGPPTGWKWHSLNDPPVLQQVMMDTNLSHPYPEITALGNGPDECVKKEDAQMLAIEFDNFLKEKSKKLGQKYRPFQIKMKAVKINEQFSLRIVDQAHVYLYFRDGAKFLKLNLGMILDSKEIIDTESVDVDNVATSVEKHPAKTDSLLELQQRLAKTRHCERVRCERERRIAGPAVVQTSSIDKMRKGVSRPLRPPPRHAPTQSGDALNNRSIRKPSQMSLYYDTRII